MWPGYTSSISHINIDNGFTGDLPSNKRQKEAGHVLLLTDYAEDDSEAVITLLIIGSTWYRKKPRPKSQKSVSNNKSKSLRPCTFIDFRLSTIILTKDSDAP
jgi:hypothetical protein